MSDRFKVLIAAGGTGGHVFPAISIADALRDSELPIEVAFVGTRDKMEWIAVPRAGYKIFSIWISGFHRQLTLKNLMFPFKLIRSILQSRSIINQFKPDLVISCGGYVAGPIGWVAARRKIPIIIQEQNSFPGVTNRLLAKNADIIFTAFQDADLHLPEGKTMLLGNPTRKSLLQQFGKSAFSRFNLNPEKPVLLILGGSGGARNINDAVKLHLDYLHNTLGLQILWQSGAKYFDEIRNSLATQQFPNLRLVDFIDHMPEAYAAASLVISRAGASSCAELLITGKPSILVPSPNVAGDHQTKNAKSMVASGAAECIEDDKLGRDLPETVSKLIFDAEKLQTMSDAAKSLAHPDAAEKIADYIIKNYISEEVAA